MPGIIKPLIGITTYGRDTAGRYSLPVEYVECARRAGSAVVLVPPGDADIVECLERRPYGNVVLTKGVVGPDGKDLKPEAPAGPPAAKKARKLRFFPLSASKGRHTTHTRSLVR